MAPTEDRAGPSAANRARGQQALAALGALGLVVLTASVAGMAVGAAWRPNLYVPARVGGWPGWLTGPFHALGVGLSEGRFQTLTLALGCSYLVLLVAARALPERATWTAIVASHVLLVIGPPLISLDVFGYLGYARLGVLHGLDPYGHVPAEAARDAIYSFVGWPHLHTPYGPLFTLLSYAVVPLGVAGGLWALKVIAAAASLGAIWLIVGAAGAMGLSRRRAAVFVGCNPVLLQLAVGGDHNDTLVLLATSAALALTAAAPARARRLGGGAAALAAAVGLKASAGIVLPFLLLSRSPGGQRLRRRQRVDLLAAAVAALVAVTVVGLVAFGSDLTGFVTALHEQQEMVSVHSVPAETARLFGLSGLPTWWRDLFVALFVAVTGTALVCTARGADWRTCAGWATLALVVCTAWLLPWYAIWPLPLAALSRSRVLRVATVVFCGYALALHLPATQSLLNPPRAAAAIHVHAGTRGALRTRH